jgi:hypothetical protein
MSMKSKWLKALFLMMIAVSSFGGAAMNPKEIEDLLHIMNETKVEFSIPDESDKGDGLPPLMDVDSVEAEQPHAPVAGTTSGGFQE